MIEWYHLVELGYSVNGIDWSSMWLCKSCFVGQLTNSDFSASPKNDSEMRIAFKVWCYSQRKGKKKKKKERKFMLKS